MNPTNPFLVLPELLRRVSRPARFATAGVFEGGLPSVRLRSGAIIPLPVLDASVLVDAGSPAPYGRGAATLVDPSVRSCVQVGADAFELSGSRFALGLRQAERAVATAFGLGEAAVRAELYKLLVYRPGDHFAPHRDSEKADGMFGTLVVALPSVWEGGTLTVEHAGRSERYDLSFDEPADLPWAAFYADCVHSVEPITSGCRVVLVYNLIASGQRTTVPEVDGLVDEVEQALAALETDDAIKLILPLDHAYTPASLSFDALKGADAGRAALLIRASARARCAIHLGMVSIHERGAAEAAWPTRHRRYHEEPAYVAGGVYDRDTVIEDLSAPLGHPECPLGSVPFDDTELAPPGILDGEPFDDVRFSEATGNAGASFERSYRRAAFVIWHESRWPSLVSELEVGRAAAVADAMITSGDMSSARAVLIELLDKPDGALRTSCASTIAGGQLGAFGDIAEVDWDVPDDLEEDDDWDDDDDWDEDDDDWDEPEPSRATAAADGTVVLREPAQPAVRGDVRILELALRVDDPALVAQALGRQLPPNPWGGAATAAASDAQHALMVRALARAGADGTNAFQTVVRRFAGGHVGPAITLIRGVSSLVSAPDAPAVTARAVTAPAVAALLGVVEAAAAAGRLDGPSLAIDPEPLAELARLIVRSGLPGGLERLLEQLIPVNLDRTVVPALVALTQVEADADVRRALASLYELVARVLEARIAVPLVPPPDLTRALVVACRCAHCVPVRAFMANPRQREHAVKAREDIRQHVTSNLRGADVDLKVLCVSRPYTLMITKNNNTFDRAVAARTRDVEALAVIARA